MKKFLVLLSIFMLCFVTLSSCEKASKKQILHQDGSGSENMAQTQADSVKLQDVPVKISMMMLNHESWPYRKDWFIKKAIEEQANVQLVVEVPGNGMDLENKVKLCIALGKIPDLIYYPSTRIAQQYGPEGAFVNIMDYMAQLPDFVQWYKENSLEVMPYMTPAGALYQFPNSGMGESNRRGFLYRKDIFEKNNLSVPRNEEELYKVLKELKRLYPDSYPFVTRESVNLMAESWGSGWNIASNVPVYFNFNAKKWSYAAIEENYKALCMYFHKLYQEELMPPDWLTLQTNAWQDMIVTGRSFITCDYMSRIDGFNNMARGINPEFTIAYMPPIKGGAYGIDKMAYTSYNIAGFMVSASSENLEKVLEFMNWFYTDEAKELVSWGKAGVTYEEENNEKTFIGADSLAAIRNNYGISTNGFYLLYDFNAELSTYSHSLRQAVEEARRFDLPVQPIVSFNTDEQAVLNTIGVNLDDHRKENIYKFLTGIYPFSEWNQYVSEMKSLGVDQITALYEKAYNRLVK